VQPNDISRESLDESLCEKICLLGNLFPWICSRLFHICFAEKVDPNDEIMRSIR